MIYERYGKLIFLASSMFILFLLVFFYGAMVGRFEYWPYKTLQEAKVTTLTLLRTGTLSPENRLIRAPAERAGRIEIPRPDLVADGYRVFLGWNQNAGGYAAWLFDETGEELHTWAIDCHALDPHGPKNQAMPHGLRVLRDGSLVVNFKDCDVMGRLDACGNPVWARAGLFHHEFGRGDDGSIWVWRGEESVHSQTQYLVNFDPHFGDTIKEIRFLDDVVKLDERQTSLFAVSDDFSPVHFEQDPKNEDHDVFHPNDIDVLPSRLADRFPGFSAGDLLLSLRNLHMVAVVDPVTHRVKWNAYGPWRYQHDPDFTENGKISVYNNRKHHNENGAAVYRTEIIAIDPSTRAVSNELRDGGLEFSSKEMGTHQRMPNGNVLIVIPDEGRIIEVSASGHPVYEFNNVYSDAYNGHVENAQFVGKDYFSTVPTCADR